ncbi:MAG: ABC transporter ATP-binding protein [Nitrospirae bacterium]|nr:ABC transporter ATP-binding protein [Nitrospirota bacterium]
MRELINIAGLKKSFYTPAGELKVLRGIDTVFREGEMVSIIGVSGAGKSTFLHILGTLDRPTEGSVVYSVNGCSVDPFLLGNGELASFRNSTIGFVFQFHYLLPEFSALENVMMPGLIMMQGGKRGFQRTEEQGAWDAGKLKDRAEGLFNDLGVYARRHHKPGELSGGEQQRVAVARALLLEPGVVLADEPTGNLDSATGEELFRLLMDVNTKRGVTFVVVTHNESLSRKCHRTLEMVDGMMIHH